ncbi:hypothetical protein JCM10908_007023 [Rhodotorula pacifica]|uniref:uncharacterized protein n=1 Tax=Rhodotorula pacifica TaxID=1495444 RepID=UPI00316E73A8
MSAPTVYFLSGANRPNGLGFNLARALASQPNTLVFAGARNAAAAADLNALAKEKDNVHVVQLDATSETDASNAAKVVEEIAGKVDYLIPCAGLCTPGYLHDQDLDEARKMFEVNAFGPMILLCAFLPLLLKSDKPVFVPLSSMAGSMTYAMPMPTGYYGASKAALNFLTVKANTEHDKLCAFVCSPGLVMTDMTTESMSHPDLPRPPKEYIVELKDSVAGMVKVLGEAKRDTHGGKFIDYKGQTMPW